MVIESEPYSKDLPQLFEPNQSHIAIRPRHFTAKVSISHLHQFWSCVSIVKTRALLFNYKEYILSQRKSVTTFMESVSKPSSRYNALRLRPFVTAARFLMLSFHFCILSSLVNNAEYVSQKSRLSVFNAKPYSICHFFHQNFVFTKSCSDTTC